jgi:hypothetical protein
VEHVDWRSCGKGFEGQHCVAATIVQRVYDTELSELRVHILRNVIEVTFEINWCNGIKRIVSMQLCLVDFVVVQLLQQGLLCDQLRH